jgi:hypothetical protein
LLISARCAREQFFGHNSPLAPALARNLSLQHIAGLRFAKAVVHQERKNEANFDIPHI